MRAAVGDRVVIASSRVEGPVREGRIVEVRGADGSPPYLVQWSDTGQQALVFPGPDAHVERAPDPGAAVPGPAGGCRGAAPRQDLDRPGRRVRGPG